MRFVSNQTFSTSNKSAQGIFQNLAFCKTKQPLISLKKINKNFCSNLALIGEFSQSSKTKLSYLKLWNEIFSQGKLLISDIF